MVEKENQGKLKHF